MYLSLPLDVHCPCVRAQNISYSRNRTRLCGTNAQSEPSQPYRATDCAPPSCSPVLHVRSRFWSLWNGDRAAASAGPSSRGRRYYIEEGFRAIAVLANPNRASPEPSSGSSDDANGRPDRSYSCIEILLLGHSGREKQRGPRQGGDIVCPIVDIIGEAALRTIGLPILGRPWFVPAFNPC